MIKGISCSLNNRCQCNDIMFQRNEHRSWEFIGKFEIPREREREMMREETVNGLQHHLRQQGLRM